ncbi:hypothetical protein AB0I23_00540 [Streptomyces atratus]
MSERKKPFRPIRDPFVVQDATGVAIRTRLKDLAPADDKVIRLIGAHMGGLAAADLALYSRAGFERNKDTWAGRKQGLTAQSSSRWAGAVTKGTHDQYALARRGQFACRDTLHDGIRMLLHRLSLPVGEKGTKGKPGGYRSQGEWFHKSRRLNILHAGLAAVEDDIATGPVHVVRGGKKLARNRHNLAAAGLTEAGWRDRWEAARWFLSADGESGKRFGNETIRVTPDGEVSIKLPKPLEHLANAPRGRYVALGHPIRRRTKPPRHHKSDGDGHRNVQAEPGTRGREGLRRTRNGTGPPRAATGRAVTAGNQRVQHRSGHATEHGPWQQDSPPLSF